MWIFAKGGRIFSVVNKTGRRDDHRDLIQVRGRRREDLDWLRDQALTRHRAVLPEVVATPDGDYQFRIIMTRSEWRLVAEILANSVDYPNYKATVSGPAHSVFSRIWGMLIDLVAGERRLSDAQPSLFDQTPSGRFAPRPTLVPPNPAFDDVEEPADPPADNWPEYPDENIGTAAGHGYGI